MLRSNTSQQSLTTSHFTLLSFMTYCCFCSHCLCPPWSCHTNPHCVLYAAAAAFLVSSLEMPHYSFVLPAALSRELNGITTLYDHRHHNLNATRLYAPTCRPRLSAPPLLSLMRVQWPPVPYDTTAKQHHTSQPGD